jgi:hypothetical protein
MGRRSSKGYNPKAKEQLCQFDKALLLLRWGKGMEGSRTLHL